MSMSRSAGKAGAAPRRWLRRTLVGLLALVVVAAVALRFTVFAVSTTKVNPADFDGTAAMAAQLANISAHLDANRVVFDRTPRFALISRYFEEIKGPDDERSRVLIAIRSAEQALERGDSESAIAGLLRAREDAVARPALFDAEFQHALSREIAISQLRLGEQQNCVAMHNAESCLFPLAGGGIHMVQAGPRAAVKEYLDILDKFPDDLTARWLLNIAYMTIGEYPDRVPQKWLIPPSALKSDYDLPHFAEVAADVGLNLPGRAGGIILDDLDGDGYIDVLISRVGLAAPQNQLRFFHNNGDGSFVDRTAEAGLTGITGGLNIVQTDYDNDGRLDVLIPRGAWGLQDGKHPLSLLHNDGNGHFTDVTVKAGLLSFHPILSVAWADFDNDGYLDLFVGRETVTVRGLFNWGQNSPDPIHDRAPGIPELQQHVCALYRNNHDGTFTDVAAAAGADIVGMVKGVTAGDFDNDGRMDLYVSRLLESNILLHNDGGMHFTDVSRRAGVDPIFSFPTWFFDYDNDGWPDIFVGDSPAALGLYDNAALVAADYLGLKRPQAKTPYTSRLFHNKHDGTFENVAARAGLDKVFLPMGSNFGDLDNDGWLDFYLGTGTPAYEGLVPNRMFRNDEGRKFQDVTTAGGFGHLQKGHGAAFADLDEDGDQDIYEVMGGALTGDIAYNALFENPGNGNHFLKLTLEGVKSNRPAVGARVQVTMDTPRGPRSIYSTVSSGGSFGSGPFRRELGLGDATTIRSIVVTWPATGATQKFDGPQMDRAYRLREGEPQLVPVNLRRFKLGAHTN